MVFTLASKKLFIVLYLSISILRVVTRDLVSPNPFHIIVK